MNNSTGSLLRTRRRCLKATQAGIWTAGDLVLGQQVLLCGVVSRECPGWTSVVSDKLVLGRAYPELAKACQREPRRFGVLQ
jgi:hypothetical protein